MTQRRFVMLDRDGTIVVERHYLRDPDQVELVSGAASGLRQLCEMGLGLVVVTNQSGIGRGFFDEARLSLVHRRMNELLETEDVHLDGIYWCPHRPEDDCQCRKPRTGLLEQAAMNLNFNPKTAFMIGDKSCDIQAGCRVGATTLLVRTGYGAQAEVQRETVPDCVVDDLQHAAQVIGCRLAATGWWPRPPDSGCAAHATIR